MLGHVTLQHFPQHLLFLKIFVKCYVKMLPYNRTLHQVFCKSHDIYLFTFIAHVNPFLILLIAKISKKIFTFSCHDMIRDSRIRLALSFQRICLCLSRHHLKITCIFINVKSSLIEIWTFIIIYTIWLLKVWL